MLLAAVVYKRDVSEGRLILFHNCYLSITHYNLFKYPSLFLVISLYSWYNTLNS